MSEALEDQLAKMEERAEKAEAERDEALATISSDGADACGENVLLRSRLARVVERLGKIKEEGSMGRDALHAKYGDAAPYLYAWEEVQRLASEALAAAKEER